MFLFHFTKVSNANAWAKCASLLRLRVLLKDKTQGCGRAAAVTVVFETLRARDGVSPQEARQQLNALKKCSLQKHATEVQ